MAKRYTYDALGRRVPRQAKNRQLPDHIPGTIRAWKVRKRREARAVLKAVEQLRLGIVFTPVYQKEDRSLWNELEKAVAEINERFSYRKWGR